MMQIIGLAIVFGFLVMARRSMVYAVVFVEIFPRLTISLVSAMMYASSATKLYEFNYYSTPSISVATYVVCFMLVSFYIFYSHARTLNRLIDSNNIKTINTNYIERNSVFIIIFSLLYLILEVRSIGVFGVDLTISKRNYMSYVSNPFIFRFVHAVFPIFLLFSASYIIKRKNSGDYISVYFWLCLAVGFLLMVLFYSLLQQKSFIIRLPILYFAAPLLIFSSKTKNVNSLIGWFALLGFVGLFAAFAYQYREVHPLIDVPGAIANRLLLEGQLNYISFDLALSTAAKLDFFRYFGPFLDPEAAMFEAIFGYARDDLQIRASIDQWTASGLMPGFILRVDIWPIYFVIWLFVFWFSGLVFLNSYRRFMMGDVLSCFFSIKLALVLFQFVVQGTNFLSSAQFWAYVTLYLASSAAFGRLRIPLLSTTSRA